MAAIRGDHKDGGDKCRETPKMRDEKPFHVRIRAEIDFALETREIPGTGANSPHFRKEG